MKTQLIRSIPAVAVAAGLSFFVAGAQAQTVSIGTLPQGSLAYGIASAAAKVMSDKAGLTTRAVGFGGSNIFIPQVNQGKIEMSTANAVEAHFAKDGTGTFPGRKNPNLRALARLFAFQTSYMVKKDSKFQKITDFKGQAFPAGFTSQKIVEVLIRATFAMEGMTWKDVKPVPVPNFVRGTDELVSGKVVASFLAPGSAIVRKANASVKVRFLSLDATPAKLAKMRSIAPGAFFTTVKPSKRMPYIEKPTTMVGFDYLILAGKHVSDEVAYKSAKALFENKKALIAGHGVYRRFQPKEMAKKGVGVDYHPGAMKFYREAGIL